MSAADTPVRFAVIGLEHPHVYEIAATLIGAGAELAAVHSVREENLDAFTPFFGEPTRCSDPSDIIGDDTVDIVVPVESIAAEYNYYEWLCDPSHTRCLGFDEFRSYARLFGLEQISARERPLEEPLVEWMDFSRTQDVRRQEILLAVEAELEGGPRTGLQPTTRDSTLYFVQRDMAIVGRKGLGAQLAAPSGPASG